MRRNESFSELFNLLKRKVSLFMKNARALGFVLLALAILALPALARTNGGAEIKSATTANVQQIVESVDIQGNRRLRD
jgi:hypothetical protein